ncbi:redoxin domain-containing protein [Lewinella sp. JB7]|uniref:redoxin domain-containing protein n=1 Tax=Lewinella sp. JB7 TaxID=2962887 RepID=UPI0020C9C743|nr:redoxin domain-containing protein [Lewinella sp. JB7]MCP9235001.1 redoxin domain-containing protein [Lewinella sp. JB7]
MALKVGDKAPLFKLYNDEQKEVGLADYGGKHLVLLFFPLAFTGVCTDELCTMRDTLPEYNQLGSSVAAISVDSVFTLARYRADQQLNFPLLSDFNKEVSRQYGALYDTFALGMEGVSKRAAFVIDAEGVVRYAEVLESAGDQPDYSAIKETLAGLQ